MSQVEDKVYKKFEIYNRNEFETFTKSLAKKDTEVDGLMKDIRNSYAKALNGEVERLEITFPENLTKDLVLETKKKMVKDELESFLSFCLQYESRNGKINARDPSFQIGMEDSFKQVAKNFEYLEEFKFTEEHLPSTILSQAIFKFTDNDREF